jgi:putative DNA primase/helicase
MTYDVSFQKGLLLVGAPRSGKGLLLRVMEWINGSSAVVAPNLATWLKGEKSTQGLIGKKWIVFPDMRLKPPRMYGQNLDPGGLPHDSLAMLLSITSGDSVEIGQMWTQSWKGRLPGKVGIASNDVPNFNDPVLPTRLIKLAFEIGHLGTEDRELPDRLKRELPGIAQRFHRAYLRVLERGYFVQPRSSIRLEQQAAMGSDPFARFLLETYVPDPVGEATIGRIVFLRGQWCDEQGYSDNVKKSINNRTIQAKVRAVPGFAHVTLAPRPHGEYRSYLGLRAAKAGEAN